MRSRNWLVAALLLSASALTASAQGPGGPPGGGGMGGPAGTHAYLIPTDAFGPRYSNAVGCGLTITFHESPGIHHNIYVVRYYTVDPVTNAQTDVWWGGTVFAAQPGDPHKWHLFAQAFDSNGNLVDSTDYECYVQWKPIARIAVDGPQEGQAFAVNLRFVLADEDGTLIGAGAKYKRKTRGRWTSENLPAGAWSLGTATEDATWQYGPYTNSLRFFLSAPLGAAQGGPPPRPLFGMDTLFLEHTITYYDPETNSEKTIVWGTMIDAYAEFEYWLMQQI